MNNVSFDNAATKNNANLWIFSPKQVIFLFFFVEKVKIISVIIEITRIFRIELFLFLSLRFTL